MTTRRLSSDTGAQVGGGPVLAETSDGSAQADSGHAVLDGTTATKEDGDAAGGLPVSVEHAGGATTTSETSDSNTQGRADEAVLDGMPPTKDDGGATSRPVDAGAKQVGAIQQGSASINAGTTTSEDGVKQPAATTVPNCPPLIDAVIAQSSPATAAAVDSTDQNSNRAGKAEEVEKNEAADANDSTAGGVGENLPATETAPKSFGGGVGKGEAQIIVSGTENEEVSETTKAPQGQEEREEDEEEEAEKQFQERRKEGGGGDGEPNSAESRWSRSPEGSTTSIPDGAAVERVAKIADAPMDGGGRGRYESVDGETLLGKLLDESDPSAMFEDDHEKLLRKLMRVRDDEIVSNPQAYGN